MVYLERVQGNNPPMTEALVFGARVRKGQSR